MKKILLKSSKILKYTKTMNSYDPEIEDLVKEVDLYRIYGQNEFGFDEDDSSREPNGVTWGGGGSSDDPNY